MAGSGEAATNAILDDKVDVIIAQGTPDTTNAPSDLCERYKVEVRRLYRARPGRCLRGAESGQAILATAAYTDASYDVLFDALQRAGTTDREKLLEAIAKTDLDTVVGQIKFNAQHYSVQPLGGAQWAKDPKTGKLIKQNVYNKVYPSVKKEAEMRLYQQ